MKESAYNKEVSVYNDKILSFNKKYQYILKAFHIQTKFQH